MAQSNASSPTTHTAESSTKPAAADRLRDVASSAQENVDSVAQSVKGTANQVAESTTDAAQTFQTEFDSAVRRNPTLAVLGAVGVGVVLGMALNKRA